MPYTQPRKLSVADPDHVAGLVAQRLLRVLRAGPGGSRWSAEAGKRDRAPHRSAGGGGDGVVRDEAVVARMQELIQAYRTDPTAAETLQELAGLRRVLAQLWLDVEPLQLQTLDQTSVGAVTRA